MMSEVKWMDRFAHSLESLLQENHMTQRDLAKAAGISEGTISRYLNRQCMPSVNALVNIAHEFPVAGIDEILYFGDQIEMKPSRRW